MEDLNCDLVAAPVVGTLPGDGFLMAMLCITAEGAAGAFRCTEFEASGESELKGPITVGTKVALFTVFSIIILPLLMIFSWGGLPGTAYWESSP